jgi:stage V sporulation protein D (sporulation-specific penicillin-binding protein)
LTGEGVKKRKKKVRPPKRFSGKMQRKLMVVFGVIIILLAALIIRLMYIKETSGEKYEKRILSQQGYDSTTIPFQRGNITDAKGTILATSVDVYNVILDCKVLNSDKTDVEPTISALMQCFSDSIEESKVREILSEKPDSQYNILAKRLPYEQIQRFEELKEQREEEDKKKDSHINGVWFEKEYIRKYPYASLASAVVGFTTSGNLGMNGVEHSYNDVLNGINGRQYGYLNSDNDYEKTVKDAVSGNNVVMTIDANIQKVVEQKIADFIEENTNGFTEGPGAKYIGAIVMDPNNGGVLAMANYPNYDLTNPWDLSVYYTEEEIAAMNDNEKLDALNKLWTNFCITYTYEPGSTVKPFTVAAGLETGTLTDDMTFLCDGAELVSGHNIHCSNTAGHGLETMKKSIMDSCNDALMQMSFKIGVANFSNYQKIFGFGYKTNIDLPGEARTDSLIFSEAELKEADSNLATNAFGQNFNTTMIQVAGAFSSIINGGYYYQPHVVKKITDEKGNTVKEIEKTLLKETVSKETSEQLKDYLYATVSGGGTGKYAKVPGYSMGGKTGTAQKLPRGQGNYLVSFIGYAPQEHPELLIYVVVDEPNVEEQAHSTYAQEIVKEILTEIFPYMNIYPDEAVSPNATEPEGGEDGGTTDVPEQMPEGADEAMRQNEQDTAIEAPVDNPDEPVDTPEPSEPPADTPSDTPEPPADTPSDTPEPPADNPDEPANSDTPADNPDVN